MSVTVRSFAKINIGLRIGARRGDGFHDLLTMYQTIGLHDVIRVSVGRGIGIEIRCHDPTVPTDESNTCHRIVRKALAALKSRTRVVIHITKRLPVQGGLGGASSNAVSTLLALERALKKVLSAGERLRIAAEVGSDLPLFLLGGTVLGLGRGEQVYPLEDFPATACVVVTPELGVSTPKAFTRWDLTQGLRPNSLIEDNAALKPHPSTFPHLDSSTELKNLSSVKRKIFSSTELQESVLGAGTGGLRPAGQPRAAVPTQTGNGKLTMPDPSDRMIELGRGLSAWLSQSYSGAPSRRGRRENPLLELVRAGIKNDFEQVVFPEYPELSEVKSALQRAGAKYASLSGSGSALYGLFDSKAAADKAVLSLRRQGWATRQTATLTRTQYWRRVFGC